MKSTANCNIYILDREKEFDYEIVDQLEDEDIYDEDQVFSQEYLKERNLITIEI